MKILITGINGFVGGHLAEHLVQHTNHQVWGIARTGHIALPHLAENVTMVAFDMRDTDRLKGVLDDIAPDIIIHLAAQASVAKSFGDAVGTMHDNVIPSVAIMQHVADLKLDPLIIVAGSNENLRERGYHTHAHQRRRAVAPGDTLRRQQSGCRYGSLPMVCVTQTAYYSLTPV